MAAVAGTGAASDVSGLATVATGAASDVLVVTVATSGAYSDVTVPKSGNSGCIECRHRANQIPQLDSNGKLGLLMAHNDRHPSFLCLNLRIWRLLIMADTLKQIYSATALGGTELDDGEHTLLTTNSTTSLL